MIPYLSLQMHNIGLAYSDIALVNAIVQGITFVAVPLLGKHKE